MTALEAGNWLPTPRENDRIARMPPPDYGDMDPEAFRKEAHRIADWIADYFAAPERFPVLSRVQPGDIRAALPDSAPEQGESFDAIFADFERVILPGHHALEPSRILRLLRHLRQRARRARGVPVGRAQRAGDVVADVARSDRARGGLARAGSGS